MINGICDEHEKIVQKKFVGLPDMINLLLTRIDIQKEIEAEMVIFNKPVVDAIDNVLEHHSPLCCTIGIEKLNSL